MGYAAGHTVKDDLAADERHTLVIDLGMQGAVYDYLWLGIVLLLIVVVAWVVSMIRRAQSSPRPGDAPDQEVPGSGVS